MEPVLRIAPEVRLRRTASGLRASTTLGAGAGRAGPVVAAHPVDDAAVRAAEAVLGSGGLTRLPDPERAALRESALRHATPAVSRFRPAARARARAIAGTEADAYAIGLDTAHTVIEQHRHALVHDAWQRLARHDRLTVIDEVDAAFAADGSGCTCIDAGCEPEASRAYVTVVAHYPGPEVVADREPGNAPGGQSAGRMRTPSERNVIHLRALASFALAVAQRVLTVAVAVDDVHLVVVRATRDAAMPESGAALEPVYVGSLSREAVAIRDPQADPAPLLLGSAVRPMRFTAPWHELAELAPEADVDVIVQACAASAEVTAPG